MSKKQLDVSYIISLLECSILNIYNNVQTKSENITKHDG